MFKNLTIYRIAPLFVPELIEIEAALVRYQFTECGATQERSCGWVPPRGEAHGLLAESVGGQWVLRFRTEAKTIPAEVLARRVAEKAARIEQETGRKPGKVETRELKEEAKLDLLPMAFTKQAAMLVWIDPEARTLVLDTSSQCRADEVVTALVEALPGLSVSLLDTQTSPAAAMAHWLATQEPPTDFSIDRECELKSQDKEKAVVRYGRHPLDIDEVQQHIRHGKLPTKLALTWDGRVSFVLTEGLQVRKLAFLDSVFVGRSQDDSGFDADVAIATGELSRLIPDLIKALGGESVRGIGAGAGPDASAVQAFKKLDAMAKKDGFTMELSTGSGEVLATFGGQDPLYEQAVALVCRSNGKASISYVQRNLFIGYHRAAELLEDMEKAGVVSPMNSIGARKVLAQGGAA